MTNKWKPTDWRKKPIVQVPEYPDKKALENTEKTLKNLPPLVSAGESRKLQQYLADASEGKCFVLQGGDCAESFADFHPNYIRDTLRVLLQMSVILTFGASLPVIKLSRLGGQFAKPRSEPTEKKDGKELDSYRGDIINGLDFTEESRTPDPNRMIRAYNQSASTLNLLRALSQGGYADLNQVHRWNLGFVDKSPQGEKYKEIANQITESLSFMEACGINSDTVPEIREMKLFTSHESLLLSYEEALTRIDSTSGKWYDCSAHMLWVGDRTRDINGAHINFLSGLANPIGLKVGPTLGTDDLLKLIDTLNPENEKGRLTLITRLGHDSISKMLPQLLKKIKSEGKNVNWFCDPMHANTIKSSTNYKTRPLKAAKVKADKIPQLYGTQVSVGFGNTYTTKASILHNSKRSKTLSYGVLLNHFSNKYEDPHTVKNSKNTMHLYGKKISTSHIFITNIDYDRRTALYWQESSTTPEEEFFRNRFALYKFSFSAVEGTSTLDLSRSRVTIESFFFILSPNFTKISMISTFSKSPMSGTITLLAI